MPMLYEPCSHHNEQKSPTGNCLLCGGVGFTPVGVTTDQLNRMADVERALAGDLGMLPRRRLDIINDLTTRLTKARKGIQEEYDRVQRR